MERGEAKRVREYISQYLDMSGTRLSDHQAQRLVDFIENYDHDRGQSVTRTSSHRGFSSEGRYERSDSIVDTFTEEVGIHRETHHRYDDGQENHYSEEITTARGILNWLDANGR